MEKTKGERIDDCYRQYCDGAITFIEFIYWCIAEVTDKERAEYMDYTGRESDI